jgi:hypothetical protein
LKNYSIKLLEISTYQEWVLDVNYSEEIADFLEDEEDLSDILQISLSTENSEDPQLLVLNKDFVVMKFQIVAKSN